MTYLDNARYKSKSSIENLTICEEALQPRQGNSQLSRWWDLKQIQLYNEATRQTVIRVTKEHQYILSPIVPRPISANPGSNFYPGLFLFSSKVFSLAIFSFLVRLDNHQIVGKKELNWICFLSFHIWFLHFALTLGYLNPAFSDGGGGGGVIYTRR